MKKIVMALLLGAGLLMIGQTAIAQTTKGTKNTTYIEEETGKKRTTRTRNQFECGTRTPIRIGGFVTNPPFGWVNVTISKDRRVYKNDGFGYNLFEKIAKKLNLKIRNVGFPSFQDALLALRKGEIDVLAGSYYDHRVLGVGTKLLFPGYFKNPITVVFVKGKERPIHSYDDLKGLKGVIRQEEMLYSLIYQRTKGLQIEQVSGARKAYTKLLNGEVDYLITSFYAAEAETRRFKLLDDLVFNEYAQVQPELFFVFSSNSPCTHLMPQFKQALEEEQKDEKAYFQYFMTYLDAWGERFRDEPSLIQELREQKQSSQQELVEPDHPEDMTEEKTNPIDLSQGNPVPPTESNP